MKRAKSWQTGRPSSQSFWIEAQSHGASPWRRGASFRETKSDFPFSALQTLGNLAERILTPLAI